jgi:hypothetical protein
LIKNPLCGINHKQFAYILAICNRRELTPDTAGENNMAATHFSGPVVSANGFTGDITGDITGAVTGDVTGDVTGAITLPSSTTAELPAADESTGQLRVISDNGVGNDEFALVVSNGAAWVVVDTSALS